MFGKKKQKEKLPPLDPNAVESAVKRFVSSRTKLIRAEEMDAQTKLFTSGLLDSLAFIQLVTFLETEFKIRLSEGGDVNAEALDSIDAVKTAVTKARG